MSIFRMSLFSKYSWVRDAIIVLVLLTVGFFSHGLLGYTPQNNSSYAIRPLRQTDVKFRFISPLLTGGDVSALHTHLAVEKIIQEDIDTNTRQDKIKTASVYMRTLNDSRWMSVNRDEQYSPASLYKIVLLMGYLKKAETDSNILSRQITFSGTTETERLEKNLPPMISGQTYNIKQLLERLITYSDNDAKDALHENLDLTYSNQVFSDLSLPIPDVSDTGNIVTVDSYSIFFRVLYNATYLSKSMSDMALEMLSRTEYKNGLVAGVPPNITVAHKFGYRRLDASNENAPTSQLHDCGIIYYPNNPYFLCVMTKGNNIGNLTALIQSISQETYAYINATYSKKK